MEIEFYSFKRAAENIYFCTRIFEVIQYMCAALNQLDIKIF